MDEEKSALKALIESGEFLNRLNVDRKTSDLVFDERTLKALYDIMHHESIDYIDYPVSSGKESVVFKAYRKGKPVAVKVYKMSTLRFSTIGKYIEGDYRFQKESRSRSRMVYLWAKKEYTNLQALVENGVRCPAPIAFNKNILLMSYIGDSRRPAPTLREYKGDLVPLYAQISRQIRYTVRKAKIVHADLSEYNILVYRKKAYFIDIAQGVSVEHKLSRYFLERDIQNICNFFIKRGVECSSEELMDYVLSSDSDAGEQSLSLSSNSQNNRKE